MSSAARRLTVVASVGVAAAAIAFAAPTTARTLFDAQNANKLDGYHATQLAKSQNYASETRTDNFDTCGYTTVLTGTFKAPKAGYLTIAGQVNAARDAHNAAEGRLGIRVLVDGVPATAPGYVHLVDAGIEDATASTIGAVQVKTGPRMIELQIKECGAGMAYVVSKSVTVTYSPLGAVTTVPASRPVGSEN